MKNRFDIQRFFPQKGKKMSDFFNVSYRTNFGGEGAKSDSKDKCLNILQYTEKLHTY